MAGGRKRVAGSGPSQSPDLTRVDRPDQDDDEAASSYAGRVQGPTESRPTSNTAWDFAEAMGAPEHASRVLRELDPVEVIAIAAYAYVLWRRPEESPGFLVFISCVAGYHLILRPLARFGQLWLASRAQKAWGRKSPPSP